MRLDDALRRAGGAGGIDDVERLVGEDRNLGRLCALRADPLRERLAGPAVVERDALDERFVIGSFQDRGRLPVEKEDLAPQSRSIIMRLAGVDDGASGATAAPAARIPQKAAAELIEVLAQMATTSPLRTPSRSSAKAMRSMSAASPA